MIIIKNTQLIKFITLGFAKGITLWPVILVKEDIQPKTIVHEKIHAAQQVELLVIVFYIWYLIEWVFKGYKNISFEREAYKFEKDYNYLNTRKHYSFVKYL